MIHLRMVLDLEVERRVRNLRLGKVDVILSLAF
jgi:hypothetical protein